MPRRPRPSFPADGSWTLWILRPEPGQSWRLLGTYEGAGGVALDEARSPWVDPPLPTGTIVRLLRDGAPAWLGVVPPEGRETAEVRPLRPPVRRLGAFGRDWVEAWEGPGGRADWMFSECHGVDRRPLTLAACAIAREALGPLWFDDEDAALELLGAAEAWARGEGELASVARLRALFVQRAVDADTVDARDAVVLAVEVSTARHPAARAERTADKAARAQIQSFDGWDPRAYVQALRDQASLVRREVPLGDVLLARLARRASAQM